MKQRPTAGRARTKSHAQQKEQPARSLRTGTLAEMAGVNVETLRFYERKGLLPEPPRSAGGYREYPLELVRRLEFIGRAKGLGFSLGEIQELLDLRVQHDTTCAEVRARAHEKLQDIHRKVAELKRFERGLKRLMASCTGRAPASECPILDHLDGKGRRHGP